MTEENYNYRTSQTLLRNQFPGKGKLQIPIIPRFEAEPRDFDDLLLLGFDKTHLPGGAFSRFQYVSGNGTRYATL